MGFRVAPETERFLDSAESTMRLAEAFTATTIFQDVAEGHNRLMQSLLPPMRLTESIAATSVVRDMMEAHDKLLRSALPQTRLVESLAAATMFQDIAEAQNRLVQSLLPHIRLAKSIAGVLRDMMEAQDRILKSIIPQTRIADLFAQAARAYEQYESQPATRFGTSLTRNQERLLFANFVYCVVLSLIILAAVKAMGEGEVCSELFSLLTLATGLGGHQIANYARKAALRAYDSMYPPE